MSIRSVFRVQCDGPCRGWLSVPEDNPLTDDLVVTRTSVRAVKWPGERAARRAALSAGWVYTGVSPHNPEGRHATAGGGTLLCPTCKVNPLGVVLPPDPVCVCTHPRSQHYFQGLCTAIPTVAGCGCMGFLSDSTKCRECGRAGNWHRAGCSRGRNA